ncbi:MAG: hypothetical protein FWE88_07560 [Phycisphaerae bacterium]|nr:hypothetical protein [Phycisphaerae bacterium]
MPKSRQLDARPRRVVRRLNAAMWAMTLFFLVGYGLTYLLRSPAVSLPLAAVGAMWIGSRIGKPMRAAAAGMGLGAIAGIGVAIAMLSFYRPPHMLMPLDIAAVTAAGMITQPMMAAVAPAVIALSAATMTAPMQQELILQHMLAAAGFCGLAACLFGLAAQRRKQRIERQWR